MRKVRCCVDDLGISDTDRALVGAHGENAAYLFEVDGGGAWGEVAQLQGSDVVAGSSDAFGVSVSLGPDAAIVGAYRHDTDGIFDAGTAYVFELVPPVTSVFIDINN